MGIRAWFKGATLTGVQVSALERRVEELGHDHAQIRAEWEEERTAMQSMYDKLRAWSIRTAKRDKRMASDQIDLLVAPDPATPDIQPNDVAHMTKDELRRHSTSQFRRHAENKGRPA